MITSRKHDFGYYYNYDIVNYLELLQHINIMFLISLSDSLHLSG